MASSLEKLVENTLNNININRKLVWTWFIRNTKDILRKRVVYLYEWVDDINKLYYVGLPPTSDIYSSLQQESLTYYEDNHAKHVYESLGRSNISIRLS